MDVQTSTGKTTKGREQHPVTAGKQQQDCYPNPWKEFLEGDPHQPKALWRLERAKGRSQADIDSEHAADPDDGAEYMQGESESSHARGLPVRSTTEVIISCWRPALASQM